MRMANTSSTPRSRTCTNLRNNPEQRLDLVVAGTKDAVMMVESEAYELTEDEMLGAVTFAHEQIQPVIDLIIDLAEDAAKEPFDFPRRIIPTSTRRSKPLGEDKMRAPMRSSTSRSAPRPWRGQGRRLKAERRAARRPQPRLGAEESSKSPSCAATW